MFEDNYIKTAVNDKEYNAISISDMKSSINKFGGPCSIQGQLYHRYENVFLENKYKPRETYLTGSLKVDGENYYLLIRNAKIVKRYKEAGGQLVIAE
jgi:hypothetical protein